MTEFTRQVAVREHPPRSLAKGDGQDGLHPQAVESFKALSA